MMILYRVALFAVATFALVVLFDRGPQNYPQSAQAEFSSLVTWAKSLRQSPPAP